jgi:hypothetical protein
MRRKFIMATIVLSCWFAMHAEPSGHGNKEHVAVAAKTWQMIRPTEGQTDQIRTKKFVHLFRETIQVGVLCPGRNRYPH